MIFPFLLFLITVDYNIFRICSKSNLNIFFINPGKVGSDHKFVCLILDINGRSVYLSASPFFHRHDVFKQVGQTLLRPPDFFKRIPTWRTLQMFS